MANSIISASTAATYESDWSTYVSGNSNLRPAFLTGSTLITGVKMNFTEYRYLVSRTGIEQFKVRFGLDKNGALQIIISGLDINGAVITPIYALSDYTTTNHGSVNFKYEGFIPDLIAPILAQRWLDDWATQGGTIESDWFKNYGQVLQGFKAEPGNLYDLLMKHTSVSNVEVNVALNLRFYGSGAKDANASLGFFAVDENGSAYFLDRLHPCPYTC
jgi:hypothetical protein